MDYEQAQRRMDQLRKDINAAADRIRALAENLEDLGAELPTILEDAPEETIPGAHLSQAWNLKPAGDQCASCQYHTNDGRCLFSIGCVREKRP